MASAAAGAQPPDLAGAVAVGRTYNYVTEAVCDKHVGIFLKAIDTVAKLPGQGFAAIKVHIFELPVVGGRLHAASATQAPGQSLLLYASVQGPVHWQETDSTMCAAAVACSDSDLRPVQDRHMHAHGLWQIVISAALQVTALGSPQLLERMSSALMEIRSLFKEADTDGKDAVSGRLLAVSVLLVHLQPCT